MLKFTKSLTVIIGFIIATSCATPDYCECDQVSSDAIVASAGIPRDVDLGDLKRCGKKVKNDIGLEMPSDKISIDFIQQVSYEMCKFGFYEGKGKDSKKYYEDKN
jgi:hypothetical protein